MVDFDRFEDALDIRARSGGFGRDGGDYAYKTGYLISMLQTLSYIPEVAEKIRGSIRFLEESNSISEAISEDGYMGA